MNTTNNSLDIILTPPSIYRLQSIEYKESTDAMILELSDVDEFLLGNIAELNKKMDISNVYGQGATNIWQVGPVIDNFEKTISTTYKITLKIYIPSEAIAINKIKLNWQLSGFRTTTKVASTTTGTEQAHQHTMQMYDFSPENIYLLGVNSNATNMRKDSGCTAYTYTINASITAHSHTIDVSEAINEQTDSNPTMQLDVNSVGINTYVGNQQDIDITNHIVYGWNTIDLYPTTNVRGRCQLDAFVQVFLESK